MNYKFILPIVIIITVLLLAPILTNKTSEGFYVNPFNNWDQRIAAGTYNVFASGEPSNNKNPPFIYPGPWNIPTVYQEKPINVCGGLY